MKETIQKESASIEQKSKMKKLIFGLLFDAIGMLSFAVPVIGEFSDMVWAPLAGYLVSKMYAEKFGKMVGVFAFLEEIMPFSDVIPTFTLTWIYTYLIKKERR